MTHVRWLLLRPAAGTPVRITNASHVSWPGVPPPERPMILSIGFEFDVPDAYRMQLSARWRLLETDSTGEPQTYWLRRDLPARESLLQPLAITVPETPGMYELELRLEQVGGTAFDGPRAPSLRLPARVTLPPPSADQRPEIG